MRYAFLAAMFLFVFGTVSNAAIYRWTDKDGVLHVTDDELNIPDKYRKGMTIIEESEPSPVQPQVETVPERRYQTDDE